MSEPRQEPAAEAAPATPATIPLVRAPGVITPDLAASRIRRHAGLAVGGAAGLAGEILRRWMPQGAGASGEAGLLHAFPATVSAEPVSRAGVSSPTSTEASRADRTAPLLTSPLIQPAPAQGGGTPHPDAPSAAPEAEAALRPSPAEPLRAVSGGEGPVARTLRRSLAARPGESAPELPPELPIARAREAASSASGGAARSAGARLPNAPTASLPPAPPRELGRAVVRRSALGAPPAPQPPSPPVRRVAVPAAAPAAERRGEIAPVAALSSPPAPALPSVAPVSASSPISPAEGVAPVAQPPVPSRELGRAVVRRSALGSPPSPPAASLPLPVVGAAPGASPAASISRSPLAPPALPAAATSQASATDPVSGVSGAPSARASVLTGAAGEADLPLVRVQSERPAPALVQRSAAGSPVTSALTALPLAASGAAVAETASVLPAARSAAVPPLPATSVMPARPVSRRLPPLSAVSPASPISPISPASPISSPLAPPETGAIARRAASAAGNVPPSPPLPVSTVPFTGASPNLGVAIVRRRLDLPLQERLHAAATPGISTPVTGEAPSFLPAPTAPLALPAGPPPVAAGAPAAPAGGPSALPLARVVQRSSGARPGVLQRDLQGGAPSGAAESPPAAAAPSTPAAGAPAADQTHDKAFEAEELAERVLRRVLKTLAVEGERRGLRSWL